MAATASTTFEAQAADIEVCMSLPLPQPQLRRIIIRLMDDHSRNYSVAQEKGRILQQGGVACSPNDYRMVIRRDGQSDVEMADTKDVIFYSNDLHHADAVVEFQRVNSAGDKKF